MTDPSKPRWYHIDRKTRWEIAAVVAVGAVIVGWTAFDSRPHVTNGTDAGEACKDFVKAELKSPKSAEFSDVRYSGESPRWTVTGNVDAENSFGATLRNQWRCVIRLDGGWKLESLTGLD